MGCKQRMRPPNWKFHTQPRISNLLKGKIELFSIDSLVKMLAAVGRRVEVEVLTDGHSSEA